MTNLENNRIINGIQTSHINYITSFMKLELSIDHKNYLLHILVRLDAACVCHVLGAMD